MTKPYPKVNRARGGARPPAQERAAFIDANREDVVAGRRLGVESICSVLQVAPNGKINGSEPHDPVVPKPSNTH